LIPGSGRSPGEEKKQGLRSGEVEHNSKHVFLILWFMIPLAVFIISKSNLPLYVLPLFIPLAIMTAKEIERLDINLYKFRYLIFLWCVMIVLVRPFMASLDFNKDSSQFAEAIKKKHPSPVEEIVFVNTRPALGLQFYTGSNIKSVSLESKDLQNELNKKETRLWFVLENEVEQFLDIIGLHNINMKELGPIEAWNNYVLFRKNSDNI